MSEKTLKDAAEAAKTAHANTKTKVKNDDDVTVVDTTVTDEVAVVKEEDFDGAVMVGFAPKTANTPDPNAVGFDDGIPEFELTDEDLKADSPDMDDEAFVDMSATVRMQVKNYRRALIIREGFTVEEANEAALNRARKTMREENEKYLDEHPKLGIVEINKKDVDKFEFTQEEKDKMTKARGLKLIIVEDQDLKTLSIDKVDKKHKSSYLQTLDGNLSKYSVPLPITGDFATFKGAQIIQLVTAVRYNDEGLDELIAKKASLLYDRLFAGSVLTKYDEERKITMSYNDFTNLFRFHDIDMGIFGVLCASSMEEIETSLECSKCGEHFPWKYNLKNLIDLDDMSEDFKDITDQILGNKFNEDALKKIRAKNDKKLRVKSPISGNVYDLGYPSIAKAINLYKTIDQSDEIMIYHSALGLFLNGLFIYNNTTNGYLEIEDDEYKELMEALQTIPQEDIDLLMKVIQDRLYTAQFVLKSKCPACATEMSNKLNVDDLVFLKARDSKTEIMA